MSAWEELRGILINGSPVTGETVQLKNGDVVELAGTQMQFVQA